MQDKDLTFNELCLSLRDLSRAIDLIVESLEPRSICDQEEAPHRREAARQLAVKTRDKINKYFEAIKPKQKFFINLLDGTKREVSEEEWQDYVDKNCGCSEHK